MPSLHWIGKEAVVNHHHAVPFHLLRDVPELSVGEPGAGNLIVQGDNLVALKALLPYYAGQVKCIYIDPPYNTGEEEWVYNDNVNSPVIREWLGRVVGKEVEDLSRHEKWLCMMYPRLLLLRKFLSADGSIWISIDDAEIASLRLLMDEIFGRDRFVASNVWQKRYSRENREAIGDVHEYIVVYAMNPKRFKEIRNRIPITGKQAKVYKNPNNDPKGRWRPIPISAQAGHATKDQFYPITAPSGKVFKPSQGRCWALAEATFNQLRKDGRIWFGKKGDSQPNEIRYLSEVEGMVPWTWWPHEDVGHTDESKKEIYEVLGKEVDFDTPKPVRLLERVLQIATSPGDIILDSFAGSGTTGHAILKLNQSASDKIPRRFILGEMESNIARDITAERVKRVAQGYTNAKGESVEGLGGGFRFCELGEKMFDESGKIRDNVRFADLARHVYFTETGEPLPELVGDDVRRLTSKSKGKSQSLLTSSPTKKKMSPLLGVTANGLGVYLLYNGILKDKSVDGGNVLTSATLAHLPPHAGLKVIYAAGCRFSPARLKRENIIFKQTPYAIRLQ